MSTFGSAEPCISKTPLCQLKAGQNVIQGNWALGVGLVLDYNLL